MNIEQLRNFLLYCTIINFALLWLWALLWLLPHAWIYPAVNRMFHLSAEQFDAINGGLIILYKCLVLIFNLTPYLALRMM
jgi:hypothetical protein